MSIRHHRFVRVVLPLVCAAVVAGATPAYAQENEPSAFQKILGGLGLLELPKDPIHYRERPPLVVPPSSALIAPQSVDDIAQRNPDWPVDHDRKQNAPLSPGQKAAERAADYDFYSGRALTPDQLRASRTSRQAGTSRPAAKGTPESVESSQRVLSPTELGFKGWNVNNKKDEVVVFTGEPERRLLTDPPPGLRTPSRDAPYGVVTSESSKPTTSNLYDRVQGSADPGR